MDRWLSVTCHVLAIACGCAAVLLALDGFLDYLGGRPWPDRSLLRLGYDIGLLEARWFLIHDWAMPLHDALRRVPASLAAVAMIPGWWWLGSRLGR